MGRKEEFEIERFGERLDRDDAADVAEQTECDGLAVRLQNFRNRVAAAARACGRDPASIRIVPAAKTRSAQTINALLPLGVDAVGENRVQELLEKYDAVDARMQWHFIGQLQTNKVKYLIDKVALIQSLDRLLLADEIERQAVKRGLRVPCLIEINIARSPTHGGVLSEDALAFAELVRVRCPHIALKGIMGVLPHTATEGAIVDADSDSRSTTCFECGRAELAAAEMEKLSKTLAERYADMIELSMGMSEDYACAIRHGATILRPGRVLFGERVVGAVTEKGNGKV